MTKILISCRSGERAISARIRDCLNAHFGPHAASISFDAIPFGADFREQMGEELSRADGLLVIVGKNWLGKRSKASRVAEDLLWVRTELELALATGLPTIPVIVDGARMPDPGELPQSISKFAYLRAAYMKSEAEFSSCMDRIIGSIEGMKSRPHRGGNERDRLLDRAPERLAGTTTFRVGDLFAGRLAPIGNFFRRRSARYWLTAAIVLLISEFLTPYTQRYLVPVRDCLYQQISQWNPRAVEPTFTKVVLIEDGDFWKGLPAGRRPINRTYLANIVHSLDTEGAAVIALDFDVRLPDPKATGKPGNFDEIPKPYQDETKDLIKAIVDAADHDKKVVLSKTLWMDRDNGLTFAPDIYQPYGICTGLKKSQGLQKFVWANDGFPPGAIDAKAQRNISCGYIALPRDMRLLPPALEVIGQGNLDSFALAVARAYDPERVSRLPDAVYYGSYIPEAAIEASHTTVSAGEVLNPAPDDQRIQEATKAFPKKAVLVGGHWSLTQSGQGDFVDEWPTPAGPVSGVLIHENFVEAILDGRHFSAIPQPIFEALGVAFAVASVFIFSIYSGFLAKLAAFLSLSLLLVLIQWSMMLVFGTVFDAFLPLLALWLHSLLERIIG